MFLQNHWYAAALTEEIGSEPFGRTICGEAIVLFRTGTGALAALEDRCAHRHAPLSLGEVRDGVIECGYHGLRFDGSGRCVHIPGQGNIPPRAKVRAYPSVDRHGWVWVWIGDPAQADERAIPDFHWFGDPQWAGFQLYFHVDAAAQLFVDNLLDLSHVAFTHKASIGSAAAADAPVALDVTVHADRIEGRRALKDVDPGPFVAGWGDFKGNIDRTSTYVWRPPSHMQVQAEFEDATTRITVMVINPITPETETTAHFWMGWARDFCVGDTALTDKAREENTQVILEDLRIIEAQQRIMTARPDVDAVPINADKAVLAVHKELGRLFAAQDKERT